MVIRLDKLDFFSDYGFDPTGITQYFFNQGNVCNGGYGGTYYNNGSFDAVTGVYYDYLLGQNNLFLTGSAMNGAWNEIYYSNGEYSAFIGLTYDYYFGTYILLNYGPCVGGYNGQHYSPFADNFHGIDMDYSDGNLYFWKGGLPATLSHTLQSDWRQTFWNNGGDGMGEYFSVVSNAIPLPKANQIAQGVSYQLSPAPYFLYSPNIFDYGMYEAAAVNGTLLPSSDILGAGLL
jgi:hypothetical protein